MDKASVSDTGDCRFKSCQGRHFLQQTDKTLLGWGKLFLSLLHTNQTSILSCQRLQLCSMDIILRKSRLLSNHQLDRLHHNVNVAILFTNGIPFFTFRMFSFSSISLCADVCWNLCKNQLLSNQRVAPQLHTNIFSWSCGATRSESFRLDSSCKIYLT